MKNILISITAVFMASMALADYPDRPVTLVVPFAAGGPTDHIARDLAESLRKTLGQAVTVENTGGSGGTVGTARVAKAVPDGYTLLLHHIGMATAPALYRSLVYRPLDDFDYLGMVNEAPMTLIGRANFPAANYGELIKWISANPGRASLANAGVGSASHLCGLLFQSALKLPMTTVPYKGTGPAMADLASGQVDLMCDQTTNTVPQIESGKVKAYAVATTKKSINSTLAKLPTLDEAGLKGFNITVWHALYAPRGTPKAVIDKLNAALKLALKDPELLKRSEALGVTVISDSRINPAEHKRFVEAETVKWGGIIRAVGQFAD